MHLHERESQLNALHGALPDTLTGRGRTILVSGEAGIGKTSLVERFTGDIASETRILWGACEALFTPRPLGPLHDILHTLGGPLRTQLQNDARPIDLFHGLLDDIRRYHLSSVIVIEDVHWADHGTLDLVRFLARRIDRAPALLILTYRDNEVGAAHPLTLVLGDLPANSCTRIGLPGLSSKAVAAMASAANADLPDLHRISGGNPFFVAEMLREPGTQPAASIRDAVLTRASHLSPLARSVLDVVAVSPDHVDYGLLRSILGIGAAGLAECIERQLLVAVGAAVGFRHELARMAIESALPVPRRWALNRLLLDTLTANGDPAPERLARVAHHAIQTGESDAIVRWAPRAAREASGRGAYREAHTLLAATRPHIESLTPAARASFYDELARACLVVGKGEEADAMNRAALSLWKSIGDGVRIGQCLMRRIEIHGWMRPTNPDETVAMAWEAIRHLEPFGPSVELAFAYGAAGMPLRGSDAPALAAARQRALEIADALDDVRGRLNILGMVIGSEQMAHGIADGRKLERFLEDARRIGHDDALMLAYFRSGHYYLQTRALGHLEDAVARGLAFAQDRDLDRSFRALALERLGAEAAAASGDYARAEAAYERVARNPSVPWFLRTVHCEAQIALLRARRGLDFEAAPLEAAIGRQNDLYDYDLFALVRAAAEIAWLDDTRDRLEWSVRQMLDIATRWRHPWASGEALTWARLAEITMDRERVGVVGSPYDLALRGDFRAAAAAWHKRGYPYDAGLSLTLGDASDMREAIRIFESLGASRTADCVRERMRAQGARAIPRGARPTTRANPAGLTYRELQILALLVRGMSNAEIAAQLHRSVRTVEHHVATLLAKLRTDSRHEAARIARERKLVGD